MIHSLFCPSRTSRSTSRPSTASSRPPTASRFDLERGKTLGIVGESGSGKSVSSSAILGLHRGTNAKVSGEILLDGTDLLDAQRRGDAQAPRPATSR